MEPDDVHERWSDRSRAYSPEYYAYYGPDETSELLRRTLEDAIDGDASILEVGCSSGRHLAHLHEHGFEDLHGIEINDEALEVMKRTYPELAAAGTFYVDALERVLPGFDPGQFDVVFSVETLQHVHPDSEWVFPALVEVTDELLVTVENEGDGGGENEADSDADEGESEDGLDGGSENEDRDADRPVENFGPESWAREVRDVDGVPLYVRDWKRVFTDAGAEQIAAERLERDTFRAFHPAGE